MNSLYQRLKEISKEDFESLIDQLLQARYPTASITRVEGTGGDEGIDSFQGLLSDGPVVWQDKHFPNRVQKAQRTQVLKSIKAAFKNRTPRRWTLCVPINLRTTEHNWFQQSVKIPYEKKYPGTSIELIQASHIVRNLLHFKTVRDAFFPDAVSDIVKLKSLITNTDRLNLSERATVTTEYAQQFLADLKALDGRFDYEVSIGGERAPSVRREPGLAISFKKGDLVTRVFARDIDAIRLDPIKYQLKLQKAGADKILQAFETGRPQTLLSSEVVSVDSESPLIRFINEGCGHPEIRVTPQLPQPTRLVPLRLIFGKGSAAKEIRYLPFRQEYVGQREVTLRSETNLPVEVRLTLRAGEEDVNISIRPIFDAADVCDLQYVLQCIHTLQNSPSLEVFSIERGVPIFVGEGAFTVEESSDGALWAIVNDAAIVSKRFGVSLKLPGRISDEDLHSLEHLKRIATGECFEADTISSRLEKDVSRRQQVLESLQAPPAALRLEPKQDLDAFELFGTSIMVGRPIFECERVAFANAEEIRNEYIGAAPGQSVSIVWKCLGKCRFFFEEKEAATAG